MRQTVNLSPLSSWVEAGQTVGDRGALVGKIVLIVLGIALAVGVAVGLFIGGGLVLLFLRNWFAGLGSVLLVGSFFAWLFGSDWAGRLMSVGVVSMIIGALGSAIVGGDDPPDYGG